MKKIIIKIVSIVLVLCTVISLCVIPASALSVSGSFSDYFTWEKFAIRHNSTGEVESNYVYYLNYFNQSSSGTFLASYKNLLLSKGFNLFSLQSIPVKIDMNEGDTFSFSMSLLAPPCDEMVLRVYDIFKRHIGTYYFQRSVSKEFTTINEIKNYSGDSLSYGDGRVFCHRYTLSRQTVAEITEEHGEDIGFVQIQCSFSSANQIRNFWIYNEESYFTVTEKEEDTSKNQFGILGSIWNKIKDFFSAFGSFVLDLPSLVKQGLRAYFVNLPGNIKNALSSLFTGIGNTFDKVGTTLKNAFSTVGDGIKSTFTTVGDGLKSAYESVSNGLGTVFNNVGTTLKNAFTTVGDGLKTAFSAVGDAIISPIQNLGQSISDWFSNTFLGKVLRITNKSKEFISMAGNDVQYAALDLEWESTVEKGPDDWDMLHRPSFEIDIDYYNNLYPDLLVGG